MPARKYHHATIREPGDFEPGSFRTLIFPETGGVPARVIIGRLKGETKTTTQALLFPAYWTRRRVEEWIDQAGRSALRIEWANPEGDSERQRLAGAIARIHRHTLEALHALEAGDLIEAEGDIRAAVASSQAAALHLERLRHNPGPGEEYTQPQTHIREALAHLAQADRNVARHEYPAALEALGAAAQHVKTARGFLAEASDVDAARNPCHPARNPEAKGTKAPTWNPGHNEGKVDPRLRKTWLADARARGVPAVEWHHPKVGRILSYPKRGPVHFETWRAKVAERIKQIGGRVVRWYPLHKKAKRNPPPPRQLVRLGDVREVHLESGKGYRWKAGEAALLTPPGTEKESRGKGRLIMAPLRAAKPAGGSGPHKTSERTFETWHGKLPTARKSQIADIPGPDEFSRRIGQVKAIVYSSAKWQKKPASYIHEFEGPLPTLYAGPHDSFEIRGGAFRVTARGIVG